MGMYVCMNEMTRQLVTAETRFDNYIGVLFRLINMNIITSYPYFCFIGEINEILRITAHCMMSNIRRKSGDASIQSVQVNAIQI